MRGSTAGFIASLVLFGTGIAAYAVQDRDMALGLATAAGFVFFFSFIAREA